MQKGKF